MGQLPYPVQVRVRQPPVEQLPEVAFVEPGVPRFQLHFESADSGPDRSRVDLEQPRGFCDGQVRQPAYADLDEGADGVDEYLRRLRLAEQNSYLPDALAG